MGCLPGPDLEDDFGVCIVCEGTGRRIQGYTGYLLDLVYTYWYQIRWPLWTLYDPTARNFYGHPVKAFLNFPRRVRFMWREQSKERRMIRMSYRQRSKEV